MRKTERKIAVHLPLLFLMMMRNLINLFQSPQQRCKSFRTRYHFSITTVKSDRRLPPSSVINALISSIMDHTLDSEAVHHLRCRFSSSSSSPDPRYLTKEKQKTLIFFRVCVSKVTCSTKKGYVEVYYATICSSCVLVQNRV